MSYPDKVFVNTDPGDGTQRWDVDPLWINYGEYISLDKYLEVKKQSKIAEDHENTLERIIDAYRTEYHEIKEDFSNTRRQLIATRSKLDEVHDVKDALVSIGESNVKDLKVLRAEQKTQMKYIEELEQEVLKYRKEEPECDHYWQTLSVQEHSETLVCTKCNAEQVVSLKPECQHFWVYGMNEGVPARFCVACHDMEKIDVKENPSNL